MKKAKESDCRSPRSRIRMSPRKVEKSPPKSRQSNIEREETAKKTDNRRRRHRIDDLKMSIFSAIDAKQQKGGIVFDLISIDARSDWPIAARGDVFQSELLCVRGRAPRHLLSFILALLALSVSDSATFCARRFLNYS